MDTGQTVLDMETAGQLSIRDVGNRGRLFIFFNFLGI